MNRFSFLVRGFFCGALLLLGVSTHAHGADPAVPDSRDRFTPVTGTRGMVVTADSAATRAGLAILKKGGNAVDAAVAVGFVLAVTYPQAGNIGGGGFMLLYSAKTGRVHSIDYRERAPAKAHRDMFLDEKGNVDPAKSLYSHLAAGVPGTVAGLCEALDRFGTLPLKEVLKPAIRMAEEGCTVSPALSHDLRAHENALRKWPSTRSVFYHKDARPYEAGERFVQKDLARTLKGIAAKGAAAFYEGGTADRIVKEMSLHGGLITKEDLRDYRTVLRPAVHGTFQGYEVYAMGPPSSGGVHLIEMLNILEGYDLADFGHNAAASIHRMTEAMRRAYADRSRYLGDPDFYQVPLQGLTSKEYAADLRKGIDPGHASPSAAVAPGQPGRYESNETTHFAVVDGKGNAVSNTYTLNFSFGSGIVVDGAGFLLNNEMDDFSAKPGVPNAYGLIGGEANAVAPGKRMLSSMTPTIVLKEGRPFLVTGSPGGSRIISTVLQVVLNVIDFEMNIQEAVNAPRVHHQWFPDELRIEEGISPDTVRLLRGMGHKVVLQETMGAAESILCDWMHHRLFGAVDPRRGGEALGY